MHSPCRHPTSKSSQPRASKNSQSTLTKLSLMPLVSRPLKKSRAIQLRPMFRCQQSRPSSVLMTTLRTVRKKTTCEQKGKKRLACLLSQHDSVLIDLTIESTRQITISSHTWSLHQHPHVTRRDSSRTLLFFPKVSSWTISCS